MMASFCVKVKNTFRHIFNLNWIRYKYLLLLFGSLLILSITSCSATSLDKTLPLDTLEGSSIQSGNLPPSPAVVNTSSPTIILTTSSEYDLSENIHLTPTITTTPTFSPAYPDEYYIEKISGHSQYFSIGCEAAAAVDWARYFGVEIIEYNFQFELPKSDNPELGFVGDVRGPWGQAPPYAYGVHAGPVADNLQNYGLVATAVVDITLEDLKAEVASNKPVITWVIGNVVAGVPYEYTDSQGNSVMVAAYEHVVIVTGYSEDSIRYLNNGKFYETPVDNFLNSWGVLGNMAIIYDGEWQ